MIKIISSLVLAVVCLSAACFAEETQKKEKKVFSKKKNGYVSVDSTKFDFEEGIIEGRMKAPEGFFLRGRASPKLQQLIELRSHFRQELRRSSFGVRAIAK